MLVSGNNNRNEDLAQFTNYVVTIPELQQLLSETSVSISSESDYFETFLIALQIKYSTLQVKCYWRHYTGVRSAVEFFNILNCVTG